MQQNVCLNTFLSVKEEPFAGVKRICVSLVAETGQGHFNLIYIPMNVLINWLVRLLFPSGSLSNSNQRILYSSAERYFTRGDGRFSLKEEANSAIVCSGILTVIALRIFHDYVIFLFCGNFVLMSTKYF